MIAKRITLPTFEINAQPQMKWSEMQVRRYPVLDRAGWYKTVSYKWHGCDY
jgi:hypothetical protein